MIQETLERDCILRKKNIIFGKNFNAGNNLRLEAVKETAKIILSNNITIGNNVHIGAASEVKIGEHSLIGSNIIITNI